MAKCRFKSTDCLICPQNTSFDIIVAQLQTHSSQYLYIVNQTTLRYYQRLDDVTASHRRLEETVPLNIPGSSLFAYRLLDLDTFDHLTCFDERLKNRFLLGDSSPTLEAMPDIGVSIKIKPRQRKIRSLEHLGLDASPPSDCRLDPGLPDPLIIGCVVQPAPTTQFSLE